MKRTFIPYHLPLSRLCLYWPSFPVTISCSILIWGWEEGTNHPIWSSPWHMVPRSLLYAPALYASMGFPSDHSSKWGAICSVLHEWNEGMCSVASFQLPLLYICCASLNNPWGIADVSPYCKVHDPLLSILFYFENYLHPLPFRCYCRNPHHPPSHWLFRFLWQQPILPREGIKTFH